MSDLVKGICFKGMEDLILIELKRRKLELEERKVHALELVLENQQINQHSPPLSISFVINFH